MYLNGMGLRGIERVAGIHHTRIIHWIREAGCQIPDAPQQFEEIPEIIDLDQLQTFIANKRNKLWIWTAVNPGGVTTPPKPGAGEGLTDLW
jgi:insertion element IS1 protein InsB